MATEPEDIWTKEDSIVLIGEYGIDQDYMGSFVKEKEKKDDSISYATLKMDGANRKHKKKKLSVI